MNLSCHPRTSASISRYCSVSVCGLIAISMLPDMYRFINHHRKMETHEKPPKLLYYSSIIFIGVSWCCLISMIPPLLLQCASDSNFTLTVMIWSSFYSIQYYFLLLLLFIRLYYTFDGSVWKISTNTVRIYTFLYIFQPIHNMISTIIFMIDAFYGMLAFTLSLLISIILTISITILYIKKLVKVYKEATPSKERDEELISVITKITILTITSITSTFVAGIIFSSGINFNGYTLWIADLSMIFDVYVNYLCIIMGYKYFDKYYNILCGCIDSKCKRRVLKHRGHESNIADNITANVTNIAQTQSQETINTEL